MKLNAVLVVFVLAVACGQAAAASPSFTAATAQHAVVSMSSALRLRDVERAVSPVLTVLLNVGAITPRWHECHRPTDG